MGKREKLEVVFVYWAFAWDCPGCGSREFSGGVPCDAEGKRVDFRSNLPETAWEGFLEPAEVLCSKCLGRYATDGRYLESPGEESTEDIS